MIVEPYIRLPADHYGHQDAPAEWWWHIGTLTANGRSFGFEVSAAAMLQDPAFLMANIMITDVDNGRHYQSLTGVPYVSGWAETDPTQPWQVSIGTPGTNGSISMWANGTNPLDMQLEATFTDADTNTTISIALTLTNVRMPLLVWGTGRSPKPVAEGITPLTTYNFYYSLTDLAASGTIVIDGESFDVAGTTWMDHEYGAWPHSMKWALQDLQLDNGMRLSNFTQPNTPLVMNQAVPSQVTLLDGLGNSTFHSSTVTPVGASWTGASGTEYFPTVIVVIPELEAHFTVQSLIPNQEFWNPDIPQSQVYEGVARATGVFQGQVVTGTAWNEQQLC